MGVCGNDVDGGGDDGGEGYFAALARGEFGSGLRRGGEMAGPCDCTMGRGRFGGQMVGMTGEAI